MKREYLPVETLPAWAKLNGISLAGVAFGRLQAEDGTDKGCAIVATEAKINESESNPEILLKMPSDLVLSLETVHNYAKADGYLREVLEAAGDFGRTARGAILIFLIMQITYSSPDFATERHKIGVSNPWTEYIKFMPSTILLPTFYTDEELELLRGTSLRSAVEAKGISLEREFEHLRHATDNISWCQKYWWGEETGKLSFDDWRYVDAVYRSRMLDLPGSGHSMVPCVDMANHASEDAVKARYDADSEGNTVLQLRGDRKLHADEEVTISYGDEKPASEMIFSYGFLDMERIDAKQTFLDLDIPGDDPLKLAKKRFCRDAPGVQVKTAANASGATWDSPFVWWACVNEEDGLDFTVLQTTDGGKELAAIWKEEGIEVSSRLRDILAADPMWEVFQLRAVMIILDRLETQLATLRETEQIVSEVSRDEELKRAIFRPDVFRIATKLRELEANLLERGIEDLVRKRDELMATETVAAYLGQQGDNIEEDFS
ncbi:hypothetical protein ASPWEDRAFT_27807 [Aspergillus wentii DTO 134E9]|uniref:SET domain-containing protein n=1 Tax=Aspergillus wentii DTO 134E9 TaxID=1073089 RepID=A0A1L9RJQ8_ASPWE|nr:uncharacterized protein ASPWEDRAFT_27807 [Aspergillus wentii DTO 134E9]KAI9931909.1 hypothetical protein MW887_009410 [Aspergillus wentii]OJJ35134.1 hypothetical protein ASPWEDRAFT_27807 [Aspergillus wentii DTO 134E9]